MLKKNPVPAHVRRATRTAIGVFVACGLGYGILLPLESGPYANEVAKACKWAAITCVVVTVPVLGKVAQVSFERTLGTIIGGVLGFTTYEIGNRMWNNATDGWVLSLLSAGFAYLCVMASNYFKLDVSAKLSTITFLLVTFGGDDSEHGALVTALARTCGIVTGVLLSLLLSIIIWPRSASVQAVWEIKSALDALVKLNDICWTTQAIYKQELLNNMIATAPLQPNAPNQYVPLPAHDLEQAAAAALENEPGCLHERYQEEAESRLNDLYNSLAKCKDMAEQANNEILVGVFRGRWCFLPGSSCLKRTAWKDFTKDMDSVATHIRKLSRLLWMLHLNFEEGFDENMRTVLKQQYPADLFPQLMDTCRGVLVDLANAWPNQLQVPRSNLAMFLNVVDGLIAISDYYRRRVLQHMCKYQYVGRTRSPINTSMRGDGGGGGGGMREPYRRSVTSLGAMMRHVASGRGGMGDIGEEDVPSGDGVTSDLLSKGSCPTVMWPPPWGTDEREPSAGDLVQHVADMQTAGSMDIPGRRGASSAYQGSPEDAFDDLPQGVTIEVSSPTQRDAGEGSLSSRMDANEGSLVVKLQKLPTHKLELFPETAEGHVSQVRWYSFQFLLEELAEQLSDTVDGFTRLLARIQSVENDDDGWVWM